MLDFLGSRGFYPLIIPSDSAYAFCVRWRKYLYYDTKRQLKKMPRSSTDTMKKKEKDATASSHVARDSFWRDKTRGTPYKSNEKHQEHDEDL